MGFQCCFCGKPIASGALEDQDTEPLRLTVRAVGGTSAAQDLFAHGQCLTQALHPTTPFDSQVFSD